MYRQSFRVVITRVFISAPLRLVYGERCELKYDSWSPQMTRDEAKMRYIARVGQLLAKYGRN